MLFGVMCMVFHSMGLIVGDINDNGSPDNNLTIAFEENSTDFPEILDDVNNPMFYRDEQQFNGSKVYPELEVPYGVNYSAAKQLIYSPDEAGYKDELKEQIKKIFCSIKTLFLYIYVEVGVSAAWSNQLIKLLSDCSSSGVVVVR